MARIRNIKPGFFRDETLQDLQAEHPELNPMLVFAGLWTVADREGRFHWAPRTLKLDILPFLSGDMSESLEVLSGADLILKYEVNGRFYGVVKNWDRHQLAGRDEPPSEIPSPEGQFTPYDLPPNATVRARIYERDKHCCVYCQRDLHRDTRAICLDHVIPYSAGGTNTDLNLVTACKKCNAAKRDRTPHEASMPWPTGKGQRLVNGVYVIETGPVNGGLTGGDSVPDKEGEGVLGKREGNEVPASPPLAFVHLKPCEAARMYLQHEEISYPVTRFALSDVEAGIKAIQSERKLETMATLEWLLGQARKAKAGGKEVGPDWVRKAGYNKLTPKKPPPMVNAYELKMAQMRAEAGD